MSIFLKLRPPRFVGVSTGRAGTAYTSKMLQHHGFKIGHESLFTTHGFVPSVRYQGDISWLAYPYIDQIDCPMALFSREPVKIVKSLIEIGFFDPKNMSPFKKYASRFFESSGSAQDDAVRWVTMIFSNLLDRVDYHHRVGLDNDELLLDFVGDVFERNITSDSSFDFASPVNMKTERKRAIDYSELKFSDALKSEFQELIHRLGYDDRQVDQLRWG